VIASTGSAVPGGGDPADGDPAGDVRSRHERSAHAGRHRGEVTDPPPHVVARLRAAGCVFAEEEAALLVAAAPTPAALAALVDQRAAGTPLEQVVGWAAFCGLRIAVAPGVFVPRRRTEFLAGHAIELGRQAARPRTVVVDLCCGTGALGVAVAAALPGVELHAVDLDPAAVACARRNVEPIGGRVYEGDLDAPLPRELRGHVDLMLANVPYVPTGEVPLLPAEARLHEPRAALDGGADGLDVLRRVAAAAPRWLAPGGHLLVETSERQAADVVRIVGAVELVARTAASEELEATVVVGTRPAHRTGQP
jgi:release factor glutamine methyltransferase